MTAGWAEGSGGVASPTPFRVAYTGAVLIGLFAIALQPALDLYHGSLAWQVLIGAAALPIAVSLTLRRAPAWLVAPVSLPLMAAYALVIVAVSARAADVPGSVGSLTADALRGGVARLLGALLPLEAQPDTLVVPLIAVWVAALACAETAIRHRRLTAAYAAPAGMYVVTWVFAGPHADAVWWRPVAFAGLAILGALGRVWWRAVAAGAAVAALAIAAAPGITATVSAAPADFHWVSPPRDDTLDESPLVRLSGWNLDATSPLFTAAITGAPAGAAVRMRLAILPLYDGITWRVDGSYRPAGTVLGAGRSRLAAHVTIAGLDGHLLPAPERPKTITGVRAAIDPSTGALMRPRGLTPGLTYTVTAAPVEVDSDAVSADEVPSGPSVAQYLALPGASPETMLRLAEQIGSDASTAYDRADAVAGWLRGHYRLVGDAPSGHAYPNLDFFLFAPAAAGGQRGTSEQFAASFAVLGRMLGLPTRIVVGFDAVAPVSTVRGADAIAWPEVLFEHAGWVAFNPFPTTDQPLRSVEDDFAVRSTPPSAPPTEVPAPSETPPTPAESASSAAPVAHGSSHIGLLSVAGLTGCAALTAVVAALWLRRRDERRWTVGPPDKRVAHAWWAVHRSLRKAGHRAPPHLDASAVAAHASRLADTPLNELVEAVNAVTFGGVDLGEAEVRTAQKQARAYVSALRSRPIRKRRRARASGRLNEGG